jgi:hypothetical protein
LRDNVEKLIAHHPPLQHDAAMMIDPVKLKHVLGDVSTVIAALLPVAGSQPEWWRESRPSH